MFSSSKDRASGAQSRLKSHPVKTAILALFVKEHLPACSIVKLKASSPMTAQMGRGSIIFGVWLLGYAVGFVAYFVAWPVIGALIGIVSTNGDIVGGLLSGFAGSFVALGALYIWSHTGSHNQ